MSDPGIVMLAAMTGAAVVSVIRIIATAAVKHREQDRRIAEATGSTISDERIARIEASVEAIAIEVERISEGQRFTTRLLTEVSQPIPSALPKPGRFDTPH